MRKNLFFAVATMLLIFTAGSANGQREAWARQGNFSAIAADYQGNLLAVSGATLAKFDTTGASLWQQTYGASISNIHVAAEGAVFITGNFTGTILLGTYELTASSPENIFLAKLNAHGMVQWAEKINNSINSLMLASDTKGNAYVGGYAAATDHIVINSFSSAGNFRFSRAIPVNYSSVNSFNSISTDKEDNLHVFYYSGGATLNSGPPDNNVYTVTGMTRVWYDSEGYLKGAQGMMGSVANSLRNYPLGYKAKNGANDYLLTSVFRTLSGRETTSLGSCNISLPCNNVPAVNPDFDQFGNTYYAFSFVPAPPFSGCSFDENLVQVCDTGNVSYNYNASGTNIYTVINGEVVFSTRNNGNTEERPIWLSADPNGKSLYILGRWSKRAANSKFTFGSSELVDEGKMILRYGVNSSLASPLPVSFLRFYGKSQHNQNVLDWETATETNNDRFEIERSADGSLFTPIGVVKSKADNGNSTAVLSYHFTDVQPAKETLFYRIRQVDKDGKTSFSDIIVLNNLLLHPVAVYPNPVTGLLRIVLHTEKPEMLTLTVVGAGGKELLSKKMNTHSGSNSIDMNLNAVAPGYYLLKISSKSGKIVQSRTFIKQ